MATHFGAREVLKSASLDIAAGEFLTLLGESGSGKATLIFVVSVLLVIVWHRIRLRSIGAEMQQLLEGSWKPGRSNVAIAP